MPSGHDPVIRMFHCLFVVLKNSLFSMPSSHIQWSECSIVFSLFWKSHCSPCHPVTIQLSECSIVFSLFWNLTVLHAIQSWSSDQNVPLSFHCFENPTVLYAIHSWSSDWNVPLSFHCFKISLFSMPSSHDPVTRMLQSLIVLTYLWLYAKGCFPLRCF